MPRHKPKPNPFEGMTKQQALHYMSEYIAKDVMELCERVMARKLKQYSDAFLEIMEESNDT